MEGLVFQLVRGGLDNFEEPSFLLEFLVSVGLNYWMDIPPFCFLLARVYGLERTEGI